MKKIPVLFILLILVNYSFCFLNISDNYVVDVFSKANGIVSEPCQKQIDVFLGNLADTSINFFDKWSIRMVDATSKIPSGILTYHIQDLGNFQECIDIESFEKNVTVYGKYCLGYIPVDLVAIISNTTTSRNIKQQMLLKKNLARIAVTSDDSQGIPTYAPTFAICLPHRCTADDINKLINSNFTGKSDNTLQINFPNTYCQIKSDTTPELDVGAVATMAFFAVIITLMIFSTGYDLYCVHFEKKPEQIWIAFSVYTNTSKLFNMKESEANELGCLNGIKFFSMMWVIAGHNFSIPTKGPIINLEDLFNWSNTLKSMILVSGTLSVDTFFTIGGALVVYGYLKYEEKGKKLNIPMYYIHRYIRLTPPFAAAVLASATLLKYLASGPLFPFIPLGFQSTCQKWWWTSILYCQNYANVETMCLGQTWYLDIDMQLYILSPILLLLLSKCRLAGYALMAICVLICMSLSFYMAWIYDMTAIISNIYSTTNFDYMNKYYLKTHTRAAPWFIGAFLGVIIAKIRFNKYSPKINKKIMVILWILFLSAMLACIFGGHSTLRGQDYNKWGNVLYITFLRPAWSVCIAFVIFACITNNSGPINWFLSLPIYKVLNRFTYSMYILHVTLLYMLTFSTKVPLYFDPFDRTYTFWGINMLSFGLSILWVLAFESPMIIIEKVLFKRFL